MIPSGCTELRNSYRAHIRIAASGQEDSHYLLLFYGLECGLKSIYLKRNNISRTDQIRDKELQKTHDLFLMVKNLKLPAQIAGTSSPSFRLKRDGTSLHVKDAHQSWRYGIMIQTDDLKKLVEWMQAISNWIKENI